MENNAAMRSVWPFKPRVSDHRNGEDNHLGDACPELSALPYINLGCSELFAAKRALLSGDEGKKEFVPRTSARVPLTFDHRSIDGGRAGRLLERTAGRPQETVIPAA